MEKKNIIFKGRRGARAAALQVLYQIDLLRVLGRQEDGSVELAIELFRSNFNHRNLNKEFMEDLVRGVFAHQFEIDEKINEVAEHWRLERMSPVDRNILRIAVYEMMYMEGIPPAVSINEAVELGKIFGDSDSGAFINGILDRIRKHYANEEDTSC